jgi:hypothetical protein
MSTANMSAIAAASNSSAWLGRISKAAHATSAAHAPSEGTTLKIRRDLRAAAAPAHARLDTGQRIRRP